MIQHLPPDNAMQRELHGRWSEGMWMLYDLDSTLRTFLAQFQSLHREQGTAQVEPVLLPTPDQMDKQATEKRSPERKQVERDHLQSVLARANPH